MGLLTRPLRAKDIVSLASRLRPSDHADCVIHGFNPVEAIVRGALMGPAWAVVDEDHEVVGAFGWTDVGTIWSLWSELSPQHTRLIMRSAASVIRAIAALHHPLPLHNWVWVENRHTLAWLRATHCFDFSPLPLVSEDGNQFIHFQTKPLEDMPQDV